MSEQQGSSNPSGEGSGGIGAAGWVIIVIAAVIVLPWLVAFVLGAAGAVLGAVWSVVAAVLGAIGTAFGIIMGVIGGILGIFASMSFVLLLLLPGILIGILIARAMGRRDSQ